MCSPRKSNENFSIFTFYESKQMSLTQDLRWSLGRSIALQLQRQTDLLLCTINCFLQWDHLPNMAVGDLAFYYTLYLWHQLNHDHLISISKNEMSFGIVISVTSSTPLAKPTGSDWIPLTQEMRLIHTSSCTDGWGGSKSLSRTTAINNLTFYFYEFYQC